MSGDYGSTVEGASGIKEARSTTETIIIEDDAPPIQSLITETIVIKTDTSIAQQAPAATVAPNIASTPATNQAPMPGSRENLVSSHSHHQKSQKPP